VRKSSREGAQLRVSLVTKVNKGNEDFSSFGRMESSFPVDYVSLLSPAYIGQSGYGVISVATLPDPRGPSNHQAYSVLVTLQPGLGYALGEPKSAQLMIK
jgi:hypothetical protein